MTLRPTWDSKWDRSTLPAQRVTPVCPIFRKVLNVFHQVKRQIKGQKSQIKGHDPRSPIFAFLLL
jgi:hypothetical protein